MIYDLAIIGGGPAGAGASVYAARKKLNTILFAGDFSGQSVVSPDIHNWIGDITISGEELSNRLKNHVKSYESDTFKIQEGSKVTNVSGDAGNFTITTDKGENFSAKTILVVTGSNRRKLQIPGAVEFDQKGLTYCASCDGPLFSGQDVAVIGGGNAAFESAGQLLAYCQSVTLINRSKKFRADQITIDALQKNPKLKFLTDCEPVEVLGENFVTGLVYLNKETNEKLELKVSGIFVEIGHIPNTDFVKDLVARNEFNSIIVNAKNQQTNTPGVWSAGDCTDGLYHQNNIAVGDAIKAVEDIYNYLSLR